MGAFNAIVGKLFDLLLFPFNGLHPAVGLTVLSLAAGVLLLILFKYTSPQNAIARTKARLWGALHEIRLYKDELPVITSAIGRLLKENAVYFGCCSVALLPMVVVVLPVLFQLDARYGFSPLAAGDTTILNVYLSAGADPLGTGVALDLPKGVALEAGPVRVPSRRELVYRLRIAEAGRHEIRISVDGDTEIKRLDAEQGLATVSPGRFKASRTLDALMFPAEKPLPEDGRIEAIQVAHARAAMLGMDGDTYPWLIVFCVVGLVFGFALKGVLKVNL